MPYCDVRSLEPAQKRLTRLNTELRDASAQTIIRIARIREFRDRICYVSSFGTESAVMLSLISSIDRHFPVLFIDTGMHFRATLDYRDALIDRLQLTNVRNIRPDTQSLAQTDPNKNLWKTDTDACCALRKVAPLQPALGEFDAWITGRKRFHGGARARLPVFEYADERFKVNPLASWTLADVDAVFQNHQLPAHPLQEDGYRSVGCWPCTKPGGQDTDVRAGRWAGIGRTECGLHKPPAREPVRAF